MITVELVDDAGSTIPATATVWTGTEEIGYSAIEITGGAISPPPPPPVGTPTPGLFFEMKPDVYAESPKKLFAHYFAPYPTSMDNKDPSVDYYTTGYLNLHGESNSHQSYGGFHRNRPFGRAPRTGDWADADRRWEIQAAKDGGIDGFVADMLSPSGNNWDRVVALANDCDAMFPDGDFKMIPMLDCNTSLAAQTTTFVADALATFANRPCAYYLPDGRFVLGAFKAEGYSAAKWDEVFGLMLSRHGIHVAFLATFLNINYAPNYTGYPWTYGTGDWGDGSDPGIAAVTGAADKSVAVKARSEKWYQPVAPENVRPNQHVFDECKGTAAHRGWWDRAIRSNADYVQYVTWSDFSESGILMPSVTSGRVLLDLGAYKNHIWKTGAAPTILVDAIYLAHRAHFSNATFRSAADGETQFMAHWARGTGMSAVVDIVEVVTYLTAPADITVNCGGTLHTYTAPAGEYVATFPLATGTISASAVRGGTTTASITSPVTVTASPYKDEWVYYRFSSIRGTAGQYDPNLA